MIHLEERHKKIILSILEKYPYTFYAFGSRVRGTHRPLSDLDLCFKDTISSAVIAHIKEDFDESKLPFTVDIVDFNQCDENFKKNISRHLEVIKD